MLSDTPMPKSEDPEEKARLATAVAFLNATEEAHDYFDAYLDDPYEDACLGDHEDDPYGIEDDPHSFDDRDPVHPDDDTFAHGRCVALLPSQGVVRILGQDAIKLGMTCDIEYGYTRQALEVEVVDIHHSDKRLVTVERTDGKKWEHHKTHTRIMRP